MSRILAAAFTLLLAAILWRAGGNPVSPLPQALAMVTIAVVFVHAGLALGWSNALGFLAITAAVTFAVENLGAATGFPFGDYHFVVGKGLPHVGRIPLIVGFLYFGTGYCAYVAALLAMAGRPDAASPVTVALAAAFAMVLWDLAMDPVNSTLYGLWVWHRGGSYFGVPLSNFLGWLVEMFAAFLAVGLFLRRRGARFDISARPKAFWLVPLLLYLAAGLCQVAPWMTAGAGTVTDHAGQVWPVAALHGAAVLTALSTMLPFTLLAAHRLYKRPP